MKRDAVINVQVDTKAKEEAMKVFKEYGLTMTEAIELYLKEIIKCNGIPFRLTLDDGKKKKK